MSTPGCWKIRRRFMFSIAGFCVWVISYVLYSGLNTAAADTAITMSFLTLISIVGSYVFGAAWDDKNARNISIKKESDHAIK